MVLEAKWSENSGVGEYSAHQNRVIARHCESGETVAEKVWVVNARCGKSRICDSICLKDLHETCGESRVIVILAPDQDDLSVAALAQAGDGATRPVGPRPIESQPQ